jgi:hypothetical protein
MNPNAVDNLHPFKPGYDSRRDKSGRKPKRIVTDLIIKELKSQEDIIIEGYDVLTNQLTKVRVPMPTLKQIVQQLLRQAKKGNMRAVEIILERVEGKVMQPIEGDFNLPINLNFFLQPGNDPLPTLSDEIR